MVSVPETYRDLVERPVHAALATVQPNGQPQVTPVWYDLEDGYIRVNTAAGRQKFRNMIERPDVTLMAYDPDNPYRYLEVRGRVARHTEEGGDAHIDALAKKYLGADSYPFRNPAETRVVFYIEPVKVNAQG